MTVNAVSKKEEYPIPRVEDLFTALSGGKLFSKLYLSHTYQQIVLEENSNTFTIINTQKGLFQFERLPFGISSASTIYQKTIESLLEGLPGVAAYINDILMTRKSQKEHLENLIRVLFCLEEAGVTLKRHKCTFAAPSVEYLGHVIDQDGLHPSEEKVRGIKQTPRT